MNPIIGIDHGNAAMKTAHFTFPSGVTTFAHEPYTRTNLLEIEGRFHLCGSGRQPLLPDKTQSDRFYLLTLAAVAKELRYRGLPTKSEIIIAAGLPLTSFGRQKKSFKEYLLWGGEPASFVFEGTAYEVAVKDVLLFPQGYAAVLLHGEEWKNEPSVIVADIGGWTVDVMRLDNGVPNAASCRSLELGVIRLLDEAAEQTRRALGVSLTPAQIEGILRGEPCSADARAKSIVLEQGERYAQSVLAAVTECGLDVRAMPAVFLGGGAKLIRCAVTPRAGLCRAIFLGGERVNALAYERLAGELTGNGRR